ncbi:MAG: hypothetical protein QM775_02035 [Pirellulales bacterium]
MPKPQNFADLLAADKRYKRDAYGFVFEALRYAHDTLGMGTDTPLDALETPPASEQGEAKESGSSGQRHLTGGELCDAIRRYAQEQFGYMAATVLSSWGVRSTGDFGNIVFNLIDIGEMSKTKHDRREDFENVFDFDAAFRRDYVIEPTRNTSS